MRSIHVKPIRDYSPAQELALRELALGRLFIFGKRKWARGVHQPRICNNTLNSLSSRGLASFEYDSGVSHYCVITQKGRKTLAALSTPEGQQGEGRAA